MKKITHKKTAIFCIIMLFFSNCDIDSFEQKGRLTDKTVITNEPKAIAVLNGIYNSIRPASGIGHLTVALATAGIEQKYQGPIEDIHSFTTNNVKTHNVTFRGGTLYVFYKNSYSSINMINVFVKKLEEGVKGISKENTNQMLAEAKTIRANTYFNLLRVFGQFYDSNSEYGIIATTEYINGFDFPKRNTVEETYKLIISDLQFAIKHGSNKRINRNPSDSEEDEQEKTFKSKAGEGDELGEGEEGEGEGEEEEEEEDENSFSNIYITKTFSKALLAKVYLAKGGKENYTKAVALCEDIIKNLGTRFDLEKRYSTIFRKNFKSKEILFAPYFKTGGKEVNRIFFSNIYSIPTLKFVKIATRKEKESDTPTDVNNSIYDPRFSFTFERTNGNYRKYMNNASSYYFLRVAEVYLIYAEALARIGGDHQKAVAALNKIRTRAKVAPKKYNPFNLKKFLEDVRIEKLLELHIENAQPWFDLVRYDRLGDLSAKDIKSTITNKNKLIFPIPSRAIANNKNFGKQNPGY